MWYRAKFQAYWSVLGTWSAVFGGLGDRWAVQRVILGCWRPPRCGVPGFWIDYPSVQAVAGSGALRRARWRNHWRRLKAMAFMWAWY